MDTNQILEALERTILSDINVVFVEQPPTEDEFIDRAKNIRACMANLYPVTDEQFAGILRRIRASITIKMEVGTYIRDKKKPHQSWVPSRRATTNFFFANRFMKFMEVEKHWNPRAKATLDRVSDEILDLLGDPQSKDGFQIRGLLVGDVQSGKTGHYTAVCNKAFDMGYRVIIVLAGLTERLRVQTQGRLDSELAGLISNYYLDPNADVAIKNQAVGVGKYGKGQRVATFTAVLKDFDINVLKSNNLALEGVSDSILLVVKKNKRILNNLYQWLVKNNEKNNGKIDLPLLLIDDEADCASINFNKPEEDPTAINAAIRSILNTFSHASYMGITATPFANIFINPDGEDQMLGDDLFPRDFIYLLKPPSNYIGADQIFSDNAKFADTLVPIYATEMKNFFAFKHKKNLVLSDIPNSLKEALYYFLLVNAIRDFRGDLSAHRSMMIHVSYFNNVQDSVLDIVNEWLLRVKRDVQNYCRSDSDESKSIQNLETVWEKYNLTEKSGVSWKTILREYLYPAIAPIDVKAINQRQKAAALDYVNHEKDGMRIIAIGGNNFSRGLTLEGLIVSYFYRASHMYDTLLQMCRWFGYRDGYADLFKIWIADEVSDWYGYITRAADELKDEIQTMRDADLTPADFGLKVRQDPNSLTVTARNKMMSGTLVRRPVSVSGHLLETPRLKADLDVLKKNEGAFKTFLADAGKVGVPDGTIPLFLHKVPKKLVAHLLYNFDTHPWHLAYQGKALAEYVSTTMDDVAWDVVLLQGTGDVYEEGLDIGGRIVRPRTESRNVEVDDDEAMLRISGSNVRVGSGGCTRIGLSEKERKDVESRFHAMHPDKDVPDSAYLIKGRPPLLMLHVILSSVQSGESNFNVPKYLFALGLGFPDIGIATKTANYVVNLVEYKNWINSDSEEEV